MNGIRTASPPLALFLALLVASCSGLLESDRPPEQIWWLEPLKSNRSTDGADNQALAVDFTVVPGLDTNRILTLSTDARLNHYAGAHWADNLPELLRSIIARTLEDSGRFSTVRFREFPAGQECHLELTARRFYGQLTGSGTTNTVEIALTGHFACDDLRQRLSLNASVPVGNNRMPEIVAAFQRGLNQVLSDLLEALPNPA